MTVDVKILRDVLQRFRKYIANVSDLAMISKKVANVRRFYLKNSVNPGVYAIFGL